MSKSLTEKLKVKRIEYMDIAKGFAIIAVVIGHSGSPITNFIYLFHISLFFFISGYFYKDIYTCNPFLLLKKRLKSLYIPFLTYELIFLILHNFFYSINIYSNKISYHGVVGQLYDRPEFITRLIKIFTFQNQEQLLGIFWFFAILFEVNLLFAVISYITQRYFRQHKDYVRLIIIIISFFIGYWASYNRYSFFGHPETTLSVMSIYYLGYLFNRFESHIKFSTNFLIAAVIFLFANSFFGRIDIFSNYYPNPIFFLANSIIGIYSVLFISKKLTNNKTKILQYIGKNTIPIAGLHFLSFKIVNLLKILIYKYPIYYLAKFPVIYEHNNWWFLYAVIGILFPIIFIRYININNFNKFFRGKYHY